MQKFLLSIVIPSYNEMANLQKGTLDKVQRYFSSQNYDYEVIIVDDGSDDGSREFVQKFVNKNKHFKIIEGTHTGKAGAVTTGVLSAKGDYVLFTDMDQATPIEEIEGFLPFFKNGYDVVIGSRNTIREGAPLTRKIMARGMIITRSLLIGLSGIRDTQCGFKVFTKKAAKDIFGEIERIHHGFKEIRGSSVTAGFDIELLYVASKRGYKIKEVSVKWLYVETRRVNPLKDSIDGFLDLIRIKRNIIKKKYE